MIPNGKVGGKMILVGTDIIEIERIRKALNDRPAFVDRILSVNEKELFAKKRILDHFWLDVSPQKRLF